MYAVLLPLPPALYHICVPHFLHAVLVPLPSDLFPHCRCPATAICCSPTQVKTASASPGDWSDTGSRLNYSSF